MRIYRSTDRIPVKIADVTVKLAPLSMMVKVDVQKHVLQAVDKSDIKIMQQGIILAMRWAVKSIEGLTDSDGNPYKLKFTEDDPNKGLTDECIDELMNLEISDRLSIVCTSFVKGIQKEFYDQKGEVLKDVEVLSAEKSEEKKP